MRRAGGLRPWLARARTDPRMVAGAVLAACLTLDVIFVLITALGERPISRALRLGLDWAAPAIFEYAKLAMAAAVLLWLWRVRPVPAYGAWVAALVILLAESTLQLHRLGGSIVRQVLDRGRAVVAVGEAAILGGLGLIILLILWHGYRTTTDEAARRYTRQGVALLALLAVFAIGVDVPHLFATRAWERPLLLIEEGGELVMTSLILAHAVWHATAIRAAGATEGSAATGLGEEAGRAGG